MVGTLYGKQLSDSTDYKLIKNAYNDGKLEIELFVRDSKYIVLRYPNTKVYLLIKKELKRLLPTFTEIIV